MHPHLKRVLAVMGGLVVGMILIGLLEGLGHLLFPLPEGIDTSDMDAMAEYIKTAPAAALIWVFVAWLVGAFGGGVAASMIGKDFGRMPAYGVGIILTLFGLMNIYMIPHPAWFWLGLLIFIPAALLGYRYATSRNLA